jgi:hypothetical protein
VAINPKGRNEAGVFAFDGEGLARFGVSLSGWTGAVQKAGDVSQSLSKGAVRIYKEGYLLLRRMAAPGDGWKAL